MNMPRRDFIKGAAVVGAASLLPARPASAADPGKPTPSKGRSVAALVTPKLDTVRWGIIGLGNRGTSTLEETLLLDHSEVRALCDTHGPSLRHAVELVAKAGKPAAVEFGANPEAYKKMLERVDIDAVAICTPWRDHVPMAVAAMRAGKHAFVELPRKRSVTA